MASKRRRSLDGRRRRICHRRQSCHVVPDALFPARPFPNYAARAYSRMVTSMTQAPGVPCCCRRVAFRLRGPGDIEPSGSQRLAPWTFARGRGHRPRRHPRGTARAVARPEQPDGWSGVFRLVHMRAELTPNSPPTRSAGRAGPAHRRPRHRGASWTALGGTVTETSSARFGDISGPARTDDIELRASWTPTNTDLRPHGEAFSLALSHYAGLPPVGVTVFGQGRGR